MFGEKMPQQAPFPQGWSGQRWARLPCASQEAAPARWAGSPGSGEGKQPTLRANVVSTAGRCFSVINFAIPKCYEQDLARKTKGKGIFFFSPLWVRI